MDNSIIVSILIFIVSITMTMVGKGGGNFYVVILALSNIPMHTAATTGQFILFTASVAAVFIFQKRRTVVWQIAIMIGVILSVSALCGGYFSYLFSGFVLKILFAVMLFFAGVVMLIPFRVLRRRKNGYGGWKFKSGEELYSVNLWVAIPITMVTGFASGMVGVSGGSFLVPLMVLVVGIPMHNAVGTASILIAVSSFMGFSGHTLQGHFDPGLAIPLAIVTIVGGFMGSKFAFKTKPDILKLLFAITNWLASVFMIISAFKWM